jgi:dihydrolipoamide dehydrogenase
MRIGIIGAGSGGYVAALRAAQLGAQVTLFEEKWIGGTCLNVGCIPTKALIAGLHNARIARESAMLGVEADNIRINLTTLQKHKATVVSQNVKGIEYLLGKRGVKVVAERGTLSPGKKIVTPTGEFEFDKIIIATGSKPAMLPGIKVDGSYIMTSDEMLDVSEPPKTMLIVGGGVIGLEFAGIMSELGTKVTVVELLDRLLPQEDTECSRAAQKFVAKHNIEALTQTKVTSLFRDGTDIEATIEHGTNKEVRRFSKALMSVGRAPNLDENALAMCGINFDRKGIKVDEFMQTNVEGIYAIGDCIGGYMLAHVAYAHAKVAVSHALGEEEEPLPMSYDAIPRVTFTDPEIAACGLPDYLLEEKGINVTWSKFSYMASGRAKAQGIKDGYFKIGVDDEGIIISAIIVGEGAGEMIAFFSQAITFQTSIYELEEVIIAHPTMSEMCLEVVEVAAGHPLHS